ncbi:DUF5694 domain-containing protein [Pedobacter aquatilis]|uniref:DUF5694 domain-containing protein n=1 Tax=Pedobacter aquatilis TaxID=351343 RepID=UPI00292F083B|nr:DUF5694 domain-containing protein [Pedobacter aquatilis]
MKTILRTFALFIAFAASYFTSFAQKQEVLLIGTFHYNNPNFDAVKTDAFDVLSEKSQKELEYIAEKIKKFNPDKIFTEWDFDKQAKLDSLYQLYVDGHYNKFISEKYKSADNYAFYNENEIFQLAFRAAKNAKLKNVYGIDYFVDLPFDTVMNSIKSAKQNELMNDINTFIKKTGDDANLKRKSLSLTELTLDLNTPESRKANLSFYVRTLNKAGSNESFAGAYSVSEWYRRNLYMYSLVQKITQSTDKRIVILLGAGHISMIKEFITLEDKFKIVELKDILK